MVPPVSVYAITDDQLINMDTENMTRAINAAKEVGFYNKKVVDMFSICGHGYTPESAIVPCIEFID